jgi:bifunctional isochorismate lyase / aryl carrier protein
MLEETRAMRTEAYVDERNLAERSGVWLEAIRRRVPARPRLQLDPPRCALLIIDMQRYFADPAGRCYLPATAAITPRIAALRDAWRRLGGMVVYTQHGHAGSDDLGVLGRFFDDYIRRDEPDARIVTTLAPAPAEPVIQKSTYDAFWNTPLAETLAQRRVTQVLVTGVLTHVCCETTARAAFCRGFDVFVAADATASSREELHTSSLRAMADAVAIVLGVDEALARCRAGEA